MAENKLYTDDYIVESGIDGIWTYEKWASGTCKLWGYDTYKSLTFTATAHGSYSNLITVNYPFTVKDRVIVGNAGALCSVTNIGSGGTANSMDLRLLAHSELTETQLSDGINVNLIVFGRWK